MDEFPGNFLQQEAVDFGAGLGLNPGMCIYLF